MKKVLITFGDRKYYKSMELLASSALSVGKVDEVITYKKEELELTDFWRKNSYILSKPRGAGYWIWKPHIILLTMDKLKDGDIVMYSDAGVEIISDLTPVFDIADKKDRVVFQIAGKHKNKTWTKLDCFVLMNCNESKYWESIMTTASYHLWKKTEKNIEFLKEYQKYLRDPRIVTDDPNMFGPNILGFKDHRHDQSVLSLMTIRDGFERFRDPCQYGNEEINDFTNSPYPQLVNHHRKQL